MGGTLDAIISPLMKIQPTGILLPDIMDTPFIFTSQNAVRIAVGMFAQRGPTICVGARVARLAQDHGFDVMQTHETASALLDHGIQNGTYLRGEQVSVELNRHGKLQEFAIYRQTPIPITRDALMAIENGGLVPIYSEYAAHRLLDCAAGGTKNATAICISEKVASVLSRGDFAQIYTAPAPTSDAMMNLILDRL